MIRHSIRILCIGLLYLLFFAQAASAETLEEQLNNLVGPKQQYNTMLSPVYLRTTTTDESISPQSGELTIAQSDYVLPGRNGLDLEFKRIYKSGVSNVQEMNVKYVNGAWVDYVESSATTSSFYEDRYNIGIGMRFSFPQMEVKKNDDGTSHKFLHTESGDIYRLGQMRVDGEYVYLPEGQTVKDIVVKETSEYSNGQSDGTSKYMMTGKDGKKTYFAEDGRLLAIQDRYGNTIKFEYAEQSYAIDGQTIKKKLMSKITDSVGRVVTLEYREDSAFTVGPITNEQYAAGDSWKASQNPNNTDSGDLKGKFQVVLHLPGDKTIVYDKSAVLVSSSKHVIRTRLQRVFDVDEKPKYHYWYEQPDLGFTFNNGTQYSVFNRYENLVQIDYAKTNRIERYTYNSYTKTLHKGSMQYRKIFEEKDLVKKGFDASKSNYIDRFITEEKNKTTYSYENEADGFGFSGYVGHDNAYLKDTYRYYSTVNDVKGNTTKYTYDGIHELLLTERIGSEHKEVLKTERDEMKLVKKTETLSYQTVGGKSSGEPLKKIENFRYDEYGNLTNYTGPEALRDGNGNPTDNEHTVVYSYDYSKFHALSLKTWKQDADTTNQVIYDVDDKGSVLRETKSNTSDQDLWLVTDYAYDNYGNVTKKTVSSGGTSFVTNYEYGTDANGKDVKGAYLTKQYQVSDGVTSETKYGYDWNTGNRTVEVDPNGNKTSYEYDSFNRLVKTTQADLTSKTYTYIETPYANMKIRYKDPAQNELQYEYDIAGALVQSSVLDNGDWHVLQKVEYDGLGNKTKEIDSNGHSTRFEYDSNNRLIRRSAYENDSVSKGTMILQYRLNFDAATPLLVTMVDEEGNVKKLSYDMLSRLTKMEATPDKSEWYSTVYAYDYVGNKLAETDARGNTSSYDYNSLGQLVYLKDSLGFETQLEYNALGQIVKQKEPGGKVTDSFYNARGLQTKKKVYQEGDSDYIYVSYEYDKAGNITRTNEGGLSGGADKVSSDVSYSYNTMNRMTDVYNRIDANRIGHTRVEYDPNGSPAKKTEFADAAETKARIYSYKYDYAGRLAEESGMYREPDGQGGYKVNGNYRTLYERDYEGNIIKQSADNGGGWDTTVLVYNYLNLATLTKEPFKAGFRETKYQYDKVGRKTVETLTVGGASVATSYVYDGLGRVTKQIDPLGNTKRFVYDENGNMIKQIDPRYLPMSEDEAPGTEIEYDALNRPVKTVAFDGTSRQVMMFRVYDGRGNILLEADGEGYDAEQPKLSIGVVSRYDANDRKVAVVSAQTAAQNLQNGQENVSMRYEYDGSGRVVSVLDAFGKETRYAYFLNGMLNSVAYPDGNQERYDYDLTGKALQVATDRRGNVSKTYLNVFDRPYRIEHPNGGVERYSYSTKGEMIESIDPIGNIKRYEYDTSGFEIARMESIVSDSDYASFRRTESAYDEAGRLITRETFLAREPKRTGLAATKASAGNLVSFVYDKAGRLIKQSGPFGRESAFAYDASGNVVKKTVKVDDNYSDVWRYEFDSLSRMTEEALLVKTSELSANELAGAKLDGEYGDRVLSRTRYAYTKNGKIKSKTDAKGNTKQYVYNYDGQLVKEFDPLLAEAEYRYDLKGRLIEEVNAKGVSTQFEYDALDRLIRKIAAAANGGRAISRYVYDANGNLVRNIAPNQYDASKDNAENVSTMPGLSYAYDAMNLRTTTTSPDGLLLEAIQYNKNGQVLKMVDGIRYTGDFANSKGSEFEYNGVGQLTAQTDALGNRTEFTYNVLGNVAKQLDARGNVTQYAYNPDRTLARVINADGGVVKYAYDKQGRLVSETNPLGAVTSYRYNAFGQKKLVTDANGFTEETKYDLNGYPVSVKDKRGYVTLFKYDEKKRLVEKKWPIELDSSGSVAYAVSTYAYDAVGNIIKESLTGSKDRSFLREKLYTYADNNLVLTIADNSGAFTRFGYDPNGNVVKSEKLREADVYDIELLEYDNQNRIIKSIKLVEEPNLDASSVGTAAELRDSEYPGMIRLITGYIYDRLGNRIKVIDPRAYRFASTDTANRDKYTVTYVYDELNRMTKTIRKVNGVDVYSQTTFDEVGNRILERNERGFVTEYAYDDMNRLERKLDAELHEFKYKYDLAGNLTLSKDANGNTFGYEYDKLNRVVTVTDPYKTVIARNVYDPAGNITKKIDAKGYASAGTDGDRYGIKITYDLSGRVSTVTDAEGSKTEYRYSPAGERLLEANSNGESYSYLYDNAGRLTEVQDPLGSITSYSYDLLGNKLDMTNGRGKVTRFLYGSHGLLVGTVNPLDKPMSYRYDLALNLSEMQDRNGNHTRYSFDSRNLLLEKKVAETGDSIRYTYDESGNRASMTDASGASNYAYDKNNRLVKVVKGGAAQLSYTYDAVGNLTSVKDKEGNETVYTYDKSNRMETVAADDKTTTYRYDDNGNRVSLSYEGGVTETYTYDKNNRLLSQKNKKPDGTVLSTFAYTYDKVGRQSSKTDSYGTTEYIYDAAGRVVQVDAPGKTTIFGYDRAGNRQSLMETYTSAQPSGYIDPGTSQEVSYMIKNSEYLYDASDELLKLVETLFDASGRQVIQKTTSYLYDANGNELRSQASYVRPHNKTMKQANGGNAYGEDVSYEISTLIEKTANTFDGFNRLARAERVKAGVQTSVEYKYDGDDLRTQKVSRSSKKGYAEETTNYYYDRQHVILETNAADKVSVRYVRGVNYISRTDSSGKLSYFLFNGHGDVVHTVSESGAVENQYDYDIFGNPTLTIEQYSSAIRYTGEFFDSEVGLYYLRARYYDPYIGRFVSEDTYRGNANDPLSLNLYTYTHNNPIMFMDPSGHNAILKGQTGSDVKALQTMLNQVGYKLETDGSFGPKTEAAVKDFQKKQGIVVDGKVGNQTMSVLAAATSPTVKASNTSVPQSVKQQIMDDAKKAPVGNINPSLNTVLNSYKEPAKKEVSVSSNSKPSASPSASPTVQAKAGDPTARPDSAGNVGLKAYAESQGGTVVWNQSTQNAQVTIDGVTRYFNVNDYNTKNGHIVIDPKQVDAAFNARVTLFQHGVNSDRGTFKDMTASMGARESSIKAIDLGVISQDGVSYNKAALKELSDLGIKDTKDSRKVVDKLLSLGYNVLYRTEFSNPTGGHFEQINELSQYVNQVTRSDEKVNLVGHSKGGLVSIGYTAYNPDKVNKVITVDTPYEPNLFAKASVELMDNAAYLVKKAAEKAEKNPSIGNIAKLFAAKEAFELAMKAGTAGSQTDYSKVQGTRDLAGETDALQKIRDQWNMQQANGNLKSVDAYAIGTDSFDSLSLGGSSLFQLGDEGYNLTGHGDGIVSLESQLGKGFNGIETFTYKVSGKGRNSIAYSHIGITERKEMREYVSVVLGLQK